MSTKEPQWWNSTPVTIMLIMVAATGWIFAVYFAQKIEQMRPIITMIEPTPRNPPQPVEQPEERPLYPRGGAVR